MGYITIQWTNVGGDSFRASVRDWDENMGTMDPQKRRLEQNNRVLPKRFGTTQWQATLLQRNTTYNVFK